MSIILSDGSAWAPKKDKPPISPCEKCKDIDKRKWGECNSGFGVCAEYMDYEHMKAVYRITVFD